MAGIGDVLRSLLHGDRLSADNLAEMHQAVSDLENGLARIGTLEQDVAQLFAVLKPAVPAAAPPAAPPAPPAASGG